MIQRMATQTIIESVKPGFITIIYGARRVGKTVLLEQLKTRFPSEQPLFLNGDTDEAQQALQTTSEVKITNLVKNHSIIMIDEAQRIANISLTLKIIIDAFPNKKIFVTGSSSLEFSKGLYEHLTGRNRTFILHSLSTRELAGGEVEQYKIPSFLEDQLIYGGYPYLQQLSAPNEKKEYLRSIVTDYLFKDVVELERIGYIVSWQELSRTIGIDVKTVARYISLLERSFVVFPVGAFSSNQRKEIAKSKKYFFYDVGIRNALTDQFLPLTSRADVGQLWENFLFAERLKKQAYERERVSHYFWRNYQNAEIDMVEKRDDAAISAFEFKWSGKYYKTPKQFFEHYGVAATVLTHENYLDFVL